MKILFYGNCQLFAIKQTMNLVGYEQFHCECFSTMITQEEFDDLIKCDIIITQSICDHYRNREYLSTSYLLDHCSKDCKVVILDSLHFDFYYPDLTYMYLHNEMIAYPFHYHYVNMFRYFKQKKTERDYIHDYVNNFRIFSKNQLEHSANNSLKELTRRYEESVLKYSRTNVTILSSRDFIEQNYKKILLFYTINHPTQYLIQQVCYEICNQLQLVTQFKNVDVLAKTKCILYNCIQPLVEFSVQEHNDKINVSKMTQDYFLEYQRLGKDISKIKYKSN